MSQFLFTLTINTKIFFIFLKNFRMIIFMFYNRNTFPVYIDTMWLLTMDNETELLLPLAILKDSEPIGDGTKFFFHD